MDKERLYDGTRTRRGRRRSSKQKEKEDEQEEEKSGSKEDERKFVTLRRIPKLNSPWKNEPELESFHGGLMCVRGCMWVWVRVGEWVETTLLPLLSLILNGGRKLQKTSVMTVASPLKDFFSLPVTPLSARTCPSCL